MFWFHRTMCGLGWHGWSKRECHTYDNNGYTWFQQKRICRHCDKLHLIQFGYRLPNEKINDGTK